MGKLSKYDLFTNGSESIQIMYKLVGHSDPDDRYSGYVLEDVIIDSVSIYSEITEKFVEMIDLEHEEKAKKMIIKAHKDGDI